ncbi:hypothetical protein GCM10027187_18270 [Streptosporangium sandarakinum]|uniref:Transposase n=1 Tax=Streptosporangium sandarakinum TaxID=1260955 RepID=A0A852V6Y5_9ACTN|nr:transposase [Streptosporangium sandarakinum]NYF42914.1 transposase [Streptosporangium sandarakinum]
MRNAHPDGRKSFAWTDYRNLIQVAHQLGGPIVLVWDNLNAHLTAGIRRYITERDWLTVYQLPTYVPDLNPVEGIWSILRRTTMANRAFTDPNDLITIVRQGLHRLQYRHDVLDGCLLGTGLVPARLRRHHAFNLDNYLREEACTGRMAERYSGITLAASPQTIRSFCLRNSAS